MLDSDKNRNPLLARRIIIRYACAFALLFVAFNGLSANSVRAQAPVSWSQVLDLSRTTEPATNPAVAVDPWGHVHVFWSQKQGGLKPPAGQTPDSGNAIYHQVWDGQRWSGSIDIILGDPNDWFVVYPFAAIDKDGTIYLIWAGRSNLYFSHAPALVAHSASSWERPRAIVQATGIDQSRLLIGPTGELYLVYSRMGPSLGGDGNVTFVESGDHGATWSVPHILSAVVSEKDMASLKPRIALDRLGTLHVVWTEMWAPDWFGRRIVYVRSEDNGHAWSRPQTLAEPRGGQDWEDAPNLATTPDGKLHLVWTCGDVHRCYRFSDNGGRDWSPRQQILGAYQSLAGWDAMVADGEGTLHLVAQLRMPYGIYYAYKHANGGWSQPYQVVSQDPYSNAHFLDAALSSGNHLHVVMQNQKQGDIWYVRITTTGVPVTAVAVPKVTSIPTGTPVRLAPTSTPFFNERNASTPIAVALDTEFNQTEPVSTAQPLIMAVVPAIVVLILVLAMRLRR